MPLKARAQESGTPVDWLVRAKHNRCLRDGDELWAHMTDRAPLGEINSPMPARKVRQQPCSRHVELTAGKGKTITATCFVTREIVAPSGVTP